jgi:hypothetical protein
MTIVALVLVAGWAITAWLFLRQIQALERDWARERRELLNRIQRPDVTPADPVLYEIPEQPADEWAKVGEIRVADDYGLTDDE